MYRKLEREVSRTMDIESKVYLLSMLGRKKKGSRLRLCFWVVDEVPEKNEWICESRYMSSSKCLFTCILRVFYLPLNSSATTVYARSAACVLLSVCSLHFTLSLNFTTGPQSAVRSPQSSFYTDQFFNTDRNIITFLPNIQALQFVSKYRFLAVGM